MDKTRRFQVSGMPDPYAFSQNPAFKSTGGHLGWTRSPCIPGPAGIRVALFLIFIHLILISGAGYCVEPSKDQVTVMHYFADELGHKGVMEIFRDFETQKRVRVLDYPIGHEDFKNIVLEMAAKGYLQDVISYWAGARTQFLVDNGAMAPLDDLWEKEHLDRIIPASLLEASIYNNRHYLVPFGYHCVGFFYNPRVFARAGIKAAPKTWDELKSACAILSARGIKPFALGAKHRWPAQFWFDYILLRTAGPDFRALLMNGQASYTDPLVKNVMTIWKELIDSGFFLDGMTTEDWTDAANRVAGGGAAMTLMGTWITGYWRNKGKEPVTDYDFFIFPSINPGVPSTVVGPVDGLMISANSKNMGHAGELITYMTVDTSAQSMWVRTQGALSPNVRLGLSVYDPVMQKAVKAVADATGFAFNYDLATQPTMAEKGLTMFNQFLLSPASAEQYLQETQAVAEEVFKK
ncbi:MAG: extracellular solute-binding protein [Pseudomonadota bacterium]